MRYFVLAFVASALFACAAAKPAHESVPNISWDCGIDAAQSRGGPASIIVDGRSFVLLPQGSSGCHALHRTEYRAHDVPDYAISAAAGWFAGSGEEFYAVRRGRMLLVYHRLVEETGPLHRRYRMIARIPLPPN